ncbi:hypothetical protein J437_LFUL002489 [Ladona fulva]|uniref:Uncharacterized protein n=1 Tax=Ladona fulva TaxID=123851 RepID=A0A8K0NRF4_LADFU|nr:hypothetical protein J437_LFUL002489 [Ladona fulva]
MGNIGIRMQTSRIILALAGIFLVACNALPASKSISPQLENVVKHVGSSLDTYLAAAFTKQARRLRNTPVSLQLGDLFFHLDEATGIVTLNNVEMSGAVGLTMDGNIFQVSSYEEGEKVSSEVTVDSIDKSVVAKVVNEMRYRMNDIVRAQLNVLLNQQFVDQLFLGNALLISEFKTHVARFTLNANSIVDQILAQADAALKALGIDPIEFPDIYESFSKRFFLVRWHGSFTANKGGINGLSSFKRYKDVSLTVDGNVATIFGGIGMEEVTIGYSYYRAEFMGIGPTGTFRVGVDDPAIGIKLSVKLAEWKVSLEDFSFDHAGQFKVDITGLDAIKWVIEKIGEWVSSLLRDFMNGDIGQKIKDIIKDIADKFDPKPFLQHL